MTHWTARREGWTPHGEDARGAYDVDYSRVIHSASFRRLQGKTQILNLGDSDFYRTRLTHSLEVSQVGLGIVRQLQARFKDHEVFSYLPDTGLIQAICLTHDIGHPPFGHGGEVALNFCMRDAGGFEANGQSLRILTRLEKFSEQAGANLTRRSLAGILKYPVNYRKAKNPKLAPSLLPGDGMVRLLNRKASKPPKCYLDSEQDVVDWLLAELGAEDRVQFTKMQVVDGTKHGKAQHKSLDCSIMDVADDIAYGVHDLEDMISLGLVTEVEFREDVPEEAMAALMVWLKQRYKDEFGNNVYDGFVTRLFAKDGRIRKRQISRLVNYFITHVEPYEEQGFKEPVLRWRVRLRQDARPSLDALQAFVVGRVIKNASVQHLEFKGQQMVVAVFEALASDPAALLPADTFGKFKENADDLRVICDHVAGMTDHFLLRTYERMFSPRTGSVFDML